MKKLLLLGILSCTIFSASAQYFNGNAPAFKFGVGLSSGVATGPASGVYPEAGSLSLNFEYPLNTSVSLLLTTGYTFYVSGGGYSVGYYNSGFGASTYSYGSIASFVPLEAGIKLYVAGKFFIEGYAGVSFNINSYPADYTGKATALIYSPGIGYSFPFLNNGNSTMDVGLTYENRLEPGGGYSQVAARAVWNFGL